MKKRFKLMVSCILTLVFLFSFTCTNAFADTKTVSISTSTNFTCTGPEISGNIQSIMNSTYNYDDGSYRGTLSAQINSVNVVPVGSYYQVTVYFTYSGTVTSYTPPVITTKNVSVYADRSFTCTGPEISGNMSSIQNSTYYYDDGAYRGTLSFSQFSNVSVSQSGSYYYFNVSAQYSGMVTSY